jgi:hypothetical protein
MAFAVSPRNADDGSARYPEEYAGAPRTLRSCGGRRGCGGEEGMWR